MIAAGEGEGLQVLAENALEGGIYNADALNRMLKNSKHFQRCAWHGAFPLLSHLLCLLATHAILRTAIGVAGICWHVQSERDGILSCSNEEIVSLGDRVAYCAVS